MAARKGKTVEGEPISQVEQPIGEWAQEVITRLYVQKYGHEDRQRINALIALYVRLLSIQGIGSVSRPVEATTPKVKRVKKAKI